MISSFKQCFSNILPNQQRWVARNYQQQHHDDNNNNCYKNNHITTKKGFTLLLLFLLCIYLILTSIMMINITSSSSSSSSLSKNIDDIILYHDIIMIENIDNLENTKNEERINDDKMDHSKTNEDETINDNIDNKNENNNTNNNDIQFASCLLIMDDNHYLIEWLAYHYYVLPLKYLIVMIDPNSQTTNETIQILNKYMNITTNNTNTNNIKLPHYMNITIWYNDTDYMNDNTNEWDIAQKIVTRFFKLDSNISYNLIQHRTRQRLFYYKCMLQYQKQRQKQKHLLSSSSLLYTLLSDSDEFLLLNYDTLRTIYTNQSHKQQHQQQQQKSQEHNDDNSSSRILVPYIPSINTYGSIYQFMKHSNNQQLFFPYIQYNNNNTSIITNSTRTTTIATNNDSPPANRSLSLLSSNYLIPNHTPCIQIPRRQFGTLPLFNNTTSISSTTINSSSLLLLEQQRNMMLTTQYFYHANDNNYLMNKISKVIIDLYHPIIHNDMIVRVDSIHRPIQAICTKRQLHVRATEQILLYHHYIGSWEQYNYRNDPRNYKINYNTSNDDNNSKEKKPSRPQPEDRHYQVRRKMVCRL